MDAIQKILASQIEKLVSREDIERVKEGLHALIESRGMINDLHNDRGLTMEFIVKLQEKIEAAFEKFEAEFKKMDAKLDKIEERLVAVESKQAALKSPKVKAGE